MERSTWIILKNEKQIDGTLGTWKLIPVDFELKKDVKPVCLRPYPVPKIRVEIFKT